MNYTVVFRLELRSEWVQENQCRYLYWGYDGWCSATVSVLDYGDFIQGRSRDELSSYLWRCLNLAKSFRSNDGEYLSQLKSVVSDLYCTETHVLWTWRERALLHHSLVPVVDHRLAPSQWPNLHRWHCRTLYGTILLAIVFQDNRTLQIFSHPVIKFIKYGCWLCQLL